MVTAATPKSERVNLNPHFDFLMSAIYDGRDLHPEHLEDLRRSGLSDATIRLQRIRSVPPHMFERLLGYNVRPSVRSMLLIPYFDHRAELMPHVRVKVFPAITDGAEGHTIKYLQPRASKIRLFFPLATLADVLDGDGPLLVVEGEKKALAVAQRGWAVVGIAGIEAWHSRGSAALLADFDPIRLLGRQVEIVPDSDVRTNRTVEQAVGRFATALAVRGARAKVVVLPGTVTA
jgi:putative DNA primase/helicase